VLTGQKPSPLYSSEQYQNQQDHQNGADDARWPITPAPGVWEDGETAHQHEDKDDDKNCADAHNEFPLLYLENGKVFEVFASVSRKLSRLINPTAGVLEKFVFSAIKFNELVHALLVWRWKPRISGVRREAQGIFWPSLVALLMN
jgi:hypothetical protein